MEGENCSLTQQSQLLFNEGLSDMFYPCLFWIDDYYPFSQFTQSSPVGIKTMTEAATQKPEP
jgi:hypothetical protein